MKHELMLIFKIDLITEFMDRMDLTDNSSKVFGHFINVSLDVKDGWCLSPAVVEVFDKSFEEYTQKNSVGKLVLCGIYDSTDDIFYNFTNKKEKIRQFSNGENFLYFNTEEDIKKEDYIRAYKRFALSDKQAKDDKYVYNLLSWFDFSKEKGNENCE